MLQDPLSIAVLISGTGSNLQALIDRPDEGFTIAVLISDRQDAHGISRASAAGIPTEVIAWSAFPTREMFSDAICDTADRYGAKGLILAGFMRILSPSVIAHFPNAIINVHPALLPSFPGAHAVEQALAYGVTHTGVTVHFVDEQVDHGPIIAQEPVAILPDDDVESLHARIQTVEHALLPRVVAAFGHGELAVEGRHVRWMQPTRSDGVT
ncbi:MAG: phosphoribosylglycinamide formyltransferase [Acidimicrobiia bacterium]|nr:MAG: phosphoribosylglycinamide formyltransferase [Acidimicrobiia bacterium]